MLVGISDSERLVILAGIWAVRAVTPISFLHLLLSILWPSYSLRRYRPITGYTLIEVAFYLFFFLPRKAFLQKPAVHPPPLSPEDRHQLFTRCLHHLKDAQSFNQWFLDAPPRIPRQNVLEWLKWGFFAGEQCTNDTCSKHDEELEEYLKALENALGERFPPGVDPKLKSIRITLDDVVVYHRPVVWYLIVCIVDAISSSILKYYGFTHFSAPVPTFPPRLHTIFSTRSPSPVLSYWYKPGSTSKQPTPLLFLHGIGIGLFPYIPLLVSYSKAHTDAGILVPEFLNISGRITRPPLSPRQFESALGRIFHYHQITSYNLVGHSYGTGLSSTLIRSTTQSSHPLIPKPSSVTLLDPIPILLHLPSVARNFLYRKPKSANEHEIYFFACTDLGVAHSLSRYFFWTECALWKEDLDSLGPDKPCKQGPNVSKPRVAVVLSGEDIIVDSPAIWTYLTDTLPPTLKTTDPRPFIPPAPHPDAFIPTVCEGGNIEAYYLGGLDHAQMFLRRESWSGLVEVIDRVSRD
ncbi:unnamed protein product [Rhizoctonia solani]|uniref:AB hydrolase-1 domain-containing protein n=1 Tax=Rhizoctonia solani TaxID=456999 RepID=A0A8H2WE85_9AGAM|nr:unnamed protein product [Rhizoctonia solani]